MTRRSLIDTTEKENSNFAIALNDINMVITIKMTIINSVYLLSQIPIAPQCQAVLSIYYIRKLVFVVMVVVAGGLVEVVVVVSDLLAVDVLPYYDE